MVNKLFLIIAIAGATPLVAWLCSIVLSMLTAKQAFSWSAMAYAPLFVITMPLEGLYKILVKANQGESHLIVFVFTIIASIVYGLVAALILSPLLVSRFGNQTKD